MQDDLDEFEQRFGDYQVPEKSNNQGQVVILGSSKILSIANKMLA